MKLENKTESRKQPKERRFLDACGMAYGLEMLGERWALFVVRELMLGPRRFGDLRADLPGISANVLTQRLGELEARGIVRREMLPSPANVQVYGLTEWGYLAEPVTQELGRWAARSPLHDPTLPISAVSVMLSLRTMVDARLADGLDLVVGFQLDGVDFRGHVSGGGIVVRREPAPDAAIAFKGTPQGLAAFVHGAVPIEQLGAAGILSATGDPDLLARFRTLFPLPPKVELPASAY